MLQLSHCREHTRPHNTKPAPGEGGREMQVTVHTLNIGTATGYPLRSGMCITIYTQLLCTTIVDASGGILHKFGLAPRHSQFCQYLSFFSSY